MRRSISTSGGRKGLAPAFSYLPNVDSMSASYDDEISILTLALILAPLLAFISTLFYTHTSIQFALSRSATNRKTLLASFPPSTILLGFFHPFCNAGGGGERVIWTAVAYMQRLHPDVVSVVYTGDWPGASKEEILARASVRLPFSHTAGVRFEPRPTLAGLSHRP
jgi:hypothetical protein